MCKKETGNCIIFSRRRREFFWSGSGKNKPKLLWSLFQIMQFESYFCLETFGFHFVTGFHFPARPHGFPRQHETLNGKSIAVALTGYYNLAQLPFLLDGTVL